MAMAQNNVITPEELEKLMKKAQPAMMAAGKAVSGKNFAEARTQLGIVKDAINDSRDF